LINPKFVADPNEVASVACMICSKQDGNFVNGATFVLHGGENYPMFKIKRDKAPPAKL
jgi:hypothetical protein